MGYGVDKQLLITRIRDNLGKLKFVQLVKKFFVLVISKGLLITMVTKISTNKCSRKISFQKELKTYLPILNSKNVFFFIYVSADFCDRTSCARVYLT